MKVVKRDGSKQIFDNTKIANAIAGAMQDLGVLDRNNAAKKIAEDIESELADNKIEEIDIEQLQDIVEKKLMASSMKNVARQYVRYRYNKELLRKQNTTDETIRELLDGTSDYWNNENSNKNARLVTTQRDYIAGITSTDIARRIILPPDITEAHDEGVIHFHDMDYLAERTRTNCCLVNLDDMLQNGTMINGVMIERPHKFLTAMTIATQIITAVSSSQYGGVTVSMTHLAPFVRESYNRYYRRYKERGLTEEQCLQFAKEDTRKEVGDGVQTFNYQVNSMSSTNGQAPFLSVFLYLNETKEYKEELAMIIEEFFNQRLLGFKNRKGVYVTYAFPKLLYVLEDDNTEEGQPYWYLTELAAKCTAKRMVPDYISEKIMLRDKINKFGQGDVYGCMGCRSFLTADRIEGNPSRALNYNPEKGKYYGRFNSGVVTINLADVAFSSEGDMYRFWKIFESRLELCHRALQIRLKRLSDTKSDVAPILWQNGALARLDQNESIEVLLKGGYSTISLGYAALYECVKFMTGKSHTDGDEGERFGLAVMQKLNDKCAEWKAEENVDYSVYGTPIESTTYKFAKSLKKRFGNDIFEKLDGKDRNYITNSYHVPVFEQIDPFSKISIESKFQKLSPGGAISYIECADLTRNNKAVLEVMKYIYENIMYAELNTKSDYCQCCGYDGEIKILEENGRLIWECPQCGNRDQTKMNVARRVCGYISTNFFNQGRTDEILNRYVHLDNHDIEENY